MRHAHSVHVQRFRGNRLNSKRRKRKDIGGKGYFAILKDTKRQAQDFDDAYDYDD